MDKQTVLQSTTFGKRTAEEERKQLHAYFVETDQWRKIFSGEVDIVYGAKGSGKSAIYSLLLEREEELFDNGVMVVAAEDPRGTPVFGDLVSDPPKGEQEFRSLWKLYFLSLIGTHLRDYGVANKASKKMNDLLEEAGLLPREASLRGILKGALDYVRSLTKAESFEGGLKLDPNTGSPMVLGKITLREPSTAQRDLGFSSADDLLKLADSALEDAELSLWLVLDRLDVAFAENSDLEGNALRALFRVYLDLLALEHISLKIFLRNDIWSRIRGGFREASHITRGITISWKDKQALLNLVIRRALHNSELQTFYDVSQSQVLSDVAEQEQLFYRIFPPQVDAGPNKPKTFDWMLSRVRDGSGETAPRELIHLLSAAQEVQLQRLEVGSGDPTDETLFDRTSLKKAVPEVSKVRFEQTLCAEYPNLEKWLRRLESQKTEQKPETLAAIWSVSLEEALELAAKLVDIGFFERRESKGEISFWVPFLYRDALYMVQGSAD